MIAFGPVFFHLVYTFRNGLPAKYIVCYRLRPYYIRGKRKASRFDPICFSISGPTRCLQTAPVDEVPQCPYYKEKNIEI